MTHDLLNDSGRDPGGVGQRSGLASEGMEVEEQPRGVAVGDVSDLQVEPEHFRSFVRCQREDRLASGQGSHEGSQIACQLTRHGQRCRLAVLRVGGGNGNARGLPVEPLGRDAANLRVTLAVII
jgi:hypothetical protein